MRLAGALVGAVLLAPAAGAIEQTPPTYAGEIAPILERRCVGCHRAGGGAPMALDSYERVRPWGAAIERAVASGAMPPWHADPAHGRFANDRSLPPQERESLLLWLRSGLPAGDLRQVHVSAESPPAQDCQLPHALCRPPIASVDSERAGEPPWRIGTPDAILELPEVTVPAEGEVPYHSYMVPSPFDRDVWIEAAETRPGNPAVVHHVIVEVAAPRAAAAGDDPRTVGSLGGYVPGDEPLVMPPGLARLLPAGAQVFFQIHYTPNGEAATDRTRLALRLAKGPPRHEARTGVVSNPFLWIPAGAPEVRAEASWLFPRDAMLLSMRPHLHLRGRSFEFRARYPDGTEEILLRVPRWSFGWQTTYVLAEPKPMPVGTELLCIATWDNSGAGPDNPDPAADVSWGERTSDEMMIGFFDYYFVSPAG
ncbi:MAG TPA: alkyl hydroperoxide reductase [Thermoanaerobaculia bacterium]|nr:alkyl hydroperoxide reductase [Thermoanaerobaculia bacterium]